MITLKRVRCTVNYCLVLFHLLVGNACCGFFVVVGFFHLKDFVSNRDITFFQWRASNLELSYALLLEPVGTKGSFVFQTKCNTIFFLGGGGVYFSINRGPPSSHHEFDISTAMKFMTSIFMYEKQNLSFSVNINADMLSTYAEGRKLVFWCAWNMKRKKKLKYLFHISTLLIIFYKRK